MELTRLSVRAVSCAQAGRQAGRQAGNYRLTGWLPSDAGWGLHTISVLSLHGSGGADSRAASRYGGYVTGQVAQQLLGMYPDCQLPPDETGIAGAAGGRTQLEWCLLRPYRIDTMDVYICDARRVYMAAD